MAKDYVIITDSTCDLPERFRDYPFVDIIPFIYELNGVVYGKEKKISAKDFYDGMREGGETKTAAANIAEISEHMEKALANGKDVLFFCLSKGISSTIQNAYIARDDLKEKYPDAEICVLESLCASGGHGLLLWHAINNYRRGLTVRENMERLDSLKLNIVHKFTVDDLKYLQRGGRISKATAAVGTMINIKPLLHMDVNGNLVAETKVRGRRRALNDLVKSMGDAMGKYRDNQEFILINQSDCQEDSDYVANMIIEMYHPKELAIGDMTPTIGAHTGPGTIAIFFMGETR